MNRYSSRLLVELERLQRDYTRVCETGEDDTAIQARYRTIAGQLAALLERLLPPTPAMGDEAHGVCKDCGKWTCEHIDARLSVVLTDRDEWKREAEAAIEFVDAMRVLWSRAPSRDVTAQKIYKALVAYGAAKDSDTKASKSMSDNGEVGFVVGLLRRLTPEQQDAVTEQMLGAGDSWGTASAAFHKTWRDRVAADVAAERIVDLICEHQEQVIVRDGVGTTSDELQALIERLLPPETARAEAADKVEAERDKWKARSLRWKNWFRECQNTLRREREQTEAEVQETAWSMHRLVNERRAADRRYMVRHFMRMAEHPLPEEPCVPSDERVRFRMNLIMEEFVELLEAVWRDSKEEEVPGGLVFEAEFTHPLVAQIRKNLRELLQLPMDVNFINWTDATVDLDYVVEGARNEFGIDSNQVWTEVHRANMDKFKGERVYDEFGLKILKPGGWKPPDIEGVLRKQGWRGRDCSR